MLTSPGRPVNAGRPTSRSRPSRLRPRTAPDLGKYHLRDDDEDATTDDFTEPVMRKPVDPPTEDGGPTDAGSAEPPLLPGQGIFLPRAVLLVTRTAAEDRVLGDLWYWTVPAKGKKRPRAKFYIDGRGWVWRVLPRFAERLGLTTGQVRRALITLVGKGYVTKLRGRRGRTLLSAEPETILAAARTVLASKWFTELAKRTDKSADRWAWRHGVTVPGWALALATTAAEQRFLGQLNYWMGQSKETGRVRARIDFGDRLNWEKKSYAEWATEIFTTPAAVERAVRSLTRKGFVVVKHVANGQAAKFRINWDAVQAAYWA